MKVPFGKRATIYPGTADIEGILKDEVAGKYIQRLQVASEKRGKILVMGREIHATPWCEADTDTCSIRNWPAPRWAPGSRTSAPRPWGSITGAGIPIRVGVEFSAGNSRFCGEYSLSLLVKRTSPERLVSVGLFYLHSMCYTNIHSIYSWVCLANRQSEIDNDTGGNWLHTKNSVGLDSNLLLVYSRTFCFTRIK